MAEVNKKEKPIGVQMYDLLESNPENYDVTFSVGSTKEIVKAVKFVLKAASPVFRQEFESRWENAVVQDHEGIPLPDLNPTAFRLFIKLLILDDWSVDYIKLQNISADTSLNLLSMCRRFNITKGLPSLNEILNEFIRNMRQYTTTDGFLQLSRSNLESIISLENIPIKESEIFWAVHRWAEHQCKQQKLDATVENLREVLGRCLDEIRFPIMEAKDFAEISRSNNILTYQEKVAIYDYVLLDHENRDGYDVSNLRFKLNERKPIHETLALQDVYPSIKLGYFSCDGYTKNNEIQFSRKVALKGIGFFGPFDADSQYEIIVEIKRKLHGSVSSITGQKQQTILGKRNEVIHFTFDHPVILEPSADSSWNNFYDVCFSLKGGRNVRMLDGDNGQQNFKLGENEVKLRYWSNQKPIAKLMLDFL